MNRISSIVPRLAIVFVALAVATGRAAPPEKLPPHLDEKRYKEVLSTLFNGDIFAWSALKKDGEEVLPYVVYVLSVPEMSDVIVESALVFAREALIKFDCKKLVEPTIAHLMHEKWQVVSEAQMLLGNIGNREDCPAVTALLHSESPYNRAGAVNALAKLGGRRELFVLDLWLARPGMDEHYAMKSLKKARDSLRERLEKEAKGTPVEPTEADKAVAKLADADAKVRVGAVEALRRVGSQADSTAVVALLHDPDAKVRAAAAEWLGAVGGKRELVALEIRLREPKASDDEAFDAVAKARRAVAERVEADEKKLKAKSSDVKDGKK